jgi:hypothetical protein
MWLVKKVLVNLPVTNIPRCVSRNALGLQNLQFLNVGASSGPPGQVCIVHHKTDELLVEQHTILDEQATPLLRRGNPHEQRLVLYINVVNPLDHLDQSQSQ